VTKNVALHQVVLPNILSVSLIVFVYCACKDFVNCATEMSKRKYKELTIETKVALLKEARAGKSHRKIASDFGVSKSTVANIVNGGDKLLTAYHDNCSSKRKRVVGAQSEELESKVFEFFVKCRSKNIPLSGPMLQEKAKLIAGSLQLQDFKASNGWLESFRQRHNIQWKALSGESAEVNHQVSSDWKQKLPHLIADYELQNIFNADESGFFYRQLPTRSLVQKGEPCKGGKKAKERLTVLFCCSATGEMLKPMVIGNAARPRAFKQANVNPKNLPVEWKSNKKAWMTGVLFAEWLATLNSAMKRQKRKIVLIVDNATSHVDHQLSNVKILFLPPNLTSEVQPLDRGIIQTVKLSYRSQMLKMIISKASDCENASELTKAITVLDAIRWVSVAWKAVSPITVEKCFRQCGVPIGETDLTEPDMDHDDLSLEDQAGCDAISSVEADIQVHEEAGSGPDEVLKSVLQESESEDEGAEDEEMEVQPLRISHEAAHGHASALVAYAADKSPELLEKVFIIQRDIERLWAAENKASVKQASITDYFCRVNPA
jgi:transposase